MLNASDDALALCGYRKISTDIVDAPTSSYADPNGQDCPRCYQIADKRKASASSA